MNEVVDVSSLRALAGKSVRVSLRDGREFVGSLRTELLTNRSVSVYLDRGNGDGVTLYIDQIGRVGPA